MPAWWAGNRVFVRYVIYQGESSLTKEQAAAYLQWLDAGNRGEHFEQANGKKLAEAV